MKVAAFITIAGLATVASAQVLLEIDLTVVDTITITATNGLAAADSSSSFAIGFTMDSFFAAADTFVGIASFGSLTTANETGDGSPALWSYEIGRAHV